MTSAAVAIAGSLTAAATDAPAGAARVGIDAVHIPTWERHLRLGGDRLLARIYTPEEIAFSAGRIERLAARVAAKEAVLKALGTGIRGIGLREVEIVSLSTGRPTVTLHDRAADTAAELGLDHVEIALCHEHGYALALAFGVQVGSHE
jgi:holo-[acyl-carrier protein] synthase